MEKTKKSSTDTTKTTKIAKDKNPNSKPIGLGKPNFGYGKDILWISPDAFTEDLKAWKKLF